MPFHREVDVALRFGRVEQERPQGVVADERRAERVLMVLGILGEERHPGVAVERLPGRPYASSRSPPRA